MGRFKVGRKLQGIVARKRVVRLQVEIEMYGTSAQAHAVMDKVRREVELKFHPLLVKVAPLDLAAGYTPLIAGTSSEPFAQTPKAYVGDGVEVSELPPRSVVTEGRQSQADILAAIQEGPEVLLEGESSGRRLVVGRGGDKSPRGWSGRKFTPPPENDPFAEPS